MSIFVALLGLSLMIAVFARRRFLAAVEEGEGIPCGGGMTGREAAERVLAAGGADDVIVAEYGGMLPDHYDAGRRRLYLRPPRFGGTSVAAVAVAVHEACHALQHREAFTPLSLRLSALKLAQLGPAVLFIGLLAGALARMLSGRLALIILGAGIGLITLFNVMTLPVEFEASRRARGHLRRLGVFRGAGREEVFLRVLRAAAIRDLGAPLGSISHLVYHLVPMLARRAK